MPIEFRHTTLANGLDVIAECNADAHTSAVGFFVKAGARDEEPVVMGVSHFLEHMMFKGTARRSADDVNREFDEIGANYNAFTSQEQTVYYAQVLPEYLPRAIDLLGDMLRPALRDDDFNMEKNVILEEIGMYDDRPFSRLHDALLERHFGSHPMSYRVLGTTDTITALTADQMRAYFTQRYGADRIVVAGAGRIDFDSFVADVEKVSGGWTASGASRSYVDPEIEGGTFSVRDERANRHYMAMLATAPSTQDPRRYAASVLTDVIGDSDGSRLYWALVDPGLSDEADMGFYPSDQLGMYFASASCAPDRAEQVEKILLDTIDSYAGSIDNDEIERAKNKIATHLMRSGESPGGRMRSLGMQWSYLGEYRTLAEQLDNVMAVTASDIRALLADLPFKPRTIVRLGPTA